MAFQCNFERVEKKYLLTTEQALQFMPRMLEYMEPDQYGKCAVCNLYLDTEDDLLARRSLEKPKYKEKMRLRSYGIPGDGDTVFLEIKKKVKGVVYKRRAALSAAAAMAYLAGEAPLAAQGQIAREIEYMHDRYRLFPKVYLAYDRVAYAEITPGMNAVRITVDQCIRSRETDVDLRLGDAGRMLLPEGTRLMEIKTGGAYPLWLANALAEVELYPTSFSKYGRAYQTQARNRSSLGVWQAPSPRSQIVMGGYTNAFSPV